MDVITAWRGLSSRDCPTLEVYVKKFWDALLPIASYRQVPLIEQVETFCCGLPKELRDYCIKKRVESMTQMIEIAQTGYALLTGQMSGFKGSAVTMKKAVKDDENTDEVTPAASKFKGRMRGRQQQVFFLQDARGAKGPPRQ